MTQTSSQKGSSKLQQELETDIFNILQKICIFIVGLLFLPTIIAYQVIKNKPHLASSYSDSERRKNGLILAGLGLTFSLLSYYLLKTNYPSAAILVSCFCLNFVFIGFTWMGAKWVLYGLNGKDRLRVDHLFRKVNDFSPVSKHYNHKESIRNSGTVPEGDSTSVQVGISPVTNQIVSISEKSRNMHCLFAGGSGFGKTTLLKTLLIHAISRGQPAVIIDAKGSQGNIDEIRDFAKQSGLPTEKFYVFSISNPNCSDSYNPLKNGSIVEKQDRLFSALQWSELFYQSQATAYLSRLLPLLSFFKQEKVTLGDVREFMTDSSFRLEINQAFESIYKDKDCPNELQQKISELKVDINELEKWDQKVIAGLRAQLTTIDKESYGYLLRPNDSNTSILSTFEEMKKQRSKAFESTSVKARNSKKEPSTADKRAEELQWETELLSKVGIGESKTNKNTTLKREIDLKTIMEEGGVVYFQLSTMAMPDSAKRIGRLILEDLKWLAAEINSKRVKSPSFFPIFIDEFGEFASEEFPVFLEQCREAKMGLHLFFQGIGNLRQVSPDFADRMIESTAVKGVMSTSSPDGVDVWASIAGTVDALENSRQISEFSFLKLPTGMGNQRETKQMIVEHDVFRRLQPGQMVLIDKFPKFHVDLVQVWNPSEKSAAAEPTNLGSLKTLGSHRLVQKKRSSQL